VSYLSRLAVAKRSVTLLLAAALFVSGIAAWGSLKQELLPDVEFPILTIVAPYPGAGAADVASQVTERIERSLSSVPRLDTIRSTSANSIAFVLAEFEYGTDVREAVTKLEENLARAGLPAGVDPQITPLNINASPVVIAAITARANDGLARAGEIARNEILPSILSIEGVADADLTGGLETRLAVTLDPGRLAAAGVTTQQIVGLLQANNLTIPAGQLPADGTRVPVSAIGRFTDIEQVRSLVVGMSPASAGQPPAPVLLASLGSVELEDAPTTGYAQTNGRPALTITVNKTSASNTVEVADAVQAKLAEFGARYPSEITISTVSDQSVFILESRDGLLKEGGLGAIFAVLTIFLFLFSLRSTFVAAISIPLSLLTALVAMQLTGITINIFTLGGLAVAVGRVVDDSIVVLENIYRHRALGDDRMTAVLKGPREVAGAITSSTITAVAVFLPLGFAGGLVSQFFLPFALTVTFALLASLVVALTVVPVLAWFLVDRVKLSVDETGEPTNSIWVRLYEPTVRFILRNRWTKLGVVGVSSVLFVASLALIPLLPTQFLNSGSEKILRVSLAPPAGTSSETVLERAKEAEAILLTDPEIELVQTSVPAEGDTGFGTLIAAQSGRPANSATMTLRLEPSADLAASIQRIAGSLSSVETNGWDVAVSEAASFTSNQMSIVVSAPDAVRVEGATEQIVAALAGQPGLANLTSDLVRESEEIQVRVDPTRAIAVGMTAAQVGGEIRGALTGQTATSVQLGDGAPVSVIVRLDPGSLTSVEELRRLPVGTVAKVPLASIATVEVVAVQGTITRIDAAPSATVSAEITSEDTGAVSAAVRALLADLQASGALPPGVDARLAGVSEQQAEAFGGLFTAMGVAILLVYITMVLAFNSLVTPFVILFSLPLATIGAFPALVLTDRAVGISALIGFLMLIGIVVTNAIVLLDLVERLRAEGRSTHDALVEGGKTRVRPILMTAIATMLALAPLAAGLNEGSIIAAELGTVVIGGLFSSTFLTLVLVPVVYALVDDLKSMLRHGRQRVPDPSFEPEVVPG
jgi:hydrophobic/amphiphilic exporter-1 (mainly G- bacteria), HAE1 family